MVEFALMLPILMFALVAAVDFARVFYHDQTIINCARNGALYESDAYSPLRQKYLDYQEAALADAQSLTNPALTKANISKTSGSDAGGANVTVTVQYKFATLTSYLIPTKEVSLVQSVTMRVAQVAPDG